MASSTMSAIEELQRWYLSQCNEDWEHTYGIDIGSIDNPGWRLKVPLSGTTIEGKSYLGFSYGVGADSDKSNHNWLYTKIENNEFIGFGGPEKLEELITIFLSWAKNI